MALYKFTSKAPSQAYRNQCRSTFVRQVMLISYSSQSRNHGILHSCRGFFFAHMGWLMIKKHPEVKIKGKGIDMSDLEQDPIVMFQKRNYLWMMPIFSFVIPTLFISCVMDEPLTNAWYAGAIIRYMISIHGTWCVNSFAHFAGSKPYDK